MGSGSIFISHSHVDRDIAWRLANDLMGQKFKVWLDRLEIDLGEDWSAEIEQGLNNSSVVLVVWTQSARDSDWVPREIAWADDHKKLIVALLFDDTDVNIRIHQTQRLDFRQGWYEPIHELFVFLDQLTRQEKSSESLSEVPWRQVRSEPNQRNRFLYENQYSINVKSDAFGKNEWTKRLMMPVERSNSLQRNWIQAKRFVSVVAVPTDSSFLEVDFHRLNEYLGVLHQKGTIQIPSDAPVYRRFPFRKFRFERHQSDAYIRFLPINAERGVGGTEVIRYLRFAQGGGIDFADSCYLVQNTQHALAAFDYVHILGVVWQFAYFVGQLFEEFLNYSGELELLVNLVGTSNAVLTNYADKWESPFGRITRGFSVFPEEVEGMKCLTNNIRIVYRLESRFFDEGSESKSFVESLGFELQRSFNEKKLRPYHYKPDTEDFPWDQYDSIW